jgi:hypothetical protein
MSTLAIKQLIATLEEKLQNSPADASVKAQLKKVYAERDAQEKVVADAAAARPPVPAAAREEKLRPR